MHAQLAFLPDLDLGVVILTNSVLFGYPSAIGYRIFDAFLGRPATDWSAQIKQALNPMNSDGGGRGPSRVAGTSPSIPADQIVGRYRNSYLGDAQVTLDNGRLMLGILGLAVPLEHWHYDTYRPQWPNSLQRGVAPFLTVERDGPGRVRAIRFDRMGELARVR